LQRRSNGDRCFAGSTIALGGIWVRDVTVGQTWSCQSLSDNSAQLRNVYDSVTVADNLNSSNPIVVATTTGDGYQFSLNLLFYVSAATFENQAHARASLSIGPDLSGGFKLLKVTER
jgi:hypothetical protein